MSLTEFLRQWQGGRLAAGVFLSIALHLALIFLAIGVGLPISRYDVKRGEPLIVELPRAPDSPPPGLGGPPASQPTPPRAAPPSPPRQAPAAPPRPAPVAPPRPESVAARPEPPAPRPESAPPRPAEKAPAVSEPAPRSVAAKPEPQPQPVTPSDAGTIPVAPPPAAEEPRPAPRATADAAPAHPAPAQQPPAQQEPRQLAALPPASQHAAPPPPNALSALRRGGSGGAGGSGEGRAGFEGEPIPLDSADPRFSDYLERVRRAIKEKWGYPCVKNDATRECEYKTTQLVVEFGIAKNGKVPYVAVLRSSGYPIYDDYAVNAIKLADFPPIPDSFSKKGERITATFSYVVQASLTNILR